MNEIQGETVSKMNPEVKAKWVAALRSGEYKQAAMVLKNGGGHCCLGVLCDLYAREHDMPLWSAEDLGNHGDEDLGMIVRVWADIYVSDPKVSTDSGTFSLATLNDGDAGKGVRRHTFAEIADAIEAQL